MPEPSDADRIQQDLLRQELEAAQRRRDSYQDLLKELPEIFESKFRERLRPLQQRNEWLQLEGMALREQIRRVLPDSTAAAATALPQAPAVAADPVAALPEPAEKPSGPLPPSRPAAPPPAAQSEASAPQAPPIAPLPAPETLPPKAKTTAPPPAATGPDAAPAPQGHGSSPSHPARPEPIEPTRGSARSTAPPTPLRRARRRWPLTGGLLLAVALACLAIGRALLTPTPRPAAEKVVASSAAGLKPTGSVSRQPPRSATATAASLRLRSREASWLEVETAEGRTLFYGLLKGQRNFPLASGLRVRAGRPDAVLVLAPGASERPLGSVGALQWHSFPAAKVRR